MHQNEIAIIEPSSTHFYQPMWTMVGGGMFTSEDSRRETKDYLPSQSHWIQDSVQSFQPDQNSVTLKNGRKITYDTLVVAAGLQLNWGSIPGLVNALDDDACPVASIYHFRYAEKANTILSALKKGQAIFTVPVGGIKCGGAPQKVMWIWESNWASSGVRPNIDILFAYASCACLHCLSLTVIPSLSYSNKNSVYVAIPRTYSHVLDSSTYVSPVDRSFAICQSCGQILRGVDRSATALAHVSAVVFVSAHARIA